MNNESDDAKKIKRAHVRFTPKDPSLAKIDTRTAAISFKVQLYGLVLTEAFGGCSLVIRRTEELQLNGLCKIDVNEVGPLLARVVWRKDVDEELIKIGIKFLA